MTPVGTPIDIVAPNELCLETFLSAPYSSIAPNVPALKQKKFSHNGNYNILS